MKASGPLHERETIIRFDDEGENVSVWTASARVAKSLLKRVGPLYVIDEGERHMEFSFPRDFLVLPRKKRTLTQAQRDTLAKLSSSHGFQKKNTLS